MKCLKKIFIATTTIMSMAGCTSYANKDGRDTTINFTFKKGDALNSKDWRCTDIDDEKICIPSSWSVKKQSKVLFLAELNNSDINSYFVITKYNELSSGLSVNKYLKETYLQLKKDAIEIFTGYTVKRLVFNDDKVTFYGEYYTSIKKKSYLTYSTVFEKDNDLFEIALKVDSANSGQYKESYRDILFNFYHKKGPMFSAKDELKNIQVIDIAKL